MKFKLYKDRKKEWRWKLLGRNGRKLANTGEGYKRRQHCIDMIHKIILGASSAEVEE